MEGAGADRKFPVLSCSFLLLGLLGEQVRVIQYDVPNSHQVCISDLDFLFSHFLVVLLAFYVWNMLDFFQFSPASMWKSFHGNASPHPFLQVLSRHRCLLEALPHCPFDLLLAPTEPCVFSISRLTVLASSAYLFTFVVL